VVRAAGWFVPDDDPIIVAGRHRAKVLLHGLIASRMSIDKSAGPAAAGMSRREQKSAIC